MEDMHRRDFLKKAAVGLGAMALGATDVEAADKPLMKKSLSPEAGEEIKKETEEIGRITKNLELAGRDRDTKQIKKLQNELRERLERALKLLGN